jgi:hypothetical protein
VCGCVCGAWVFVWFRSCVMYDEDGSLSEVEDEDERKRRRGGDKADEEGEKERRERLN